MIPRRFADSLKSKFERMGYTLKITERTSVPEAVRRAKLIQKDIWNRIVSLNISGNSEGDCEQKNIHSQLKSKNLAQNREQKAVEKYQRKRQNTGKNEFVPLSRQMQLDRLEHIERMSRSVCKVASNVADKKDQTEADKNDLLSLFRTKIAAKRKDIFQSKNENPLSGLCCNHSGAPRCN